MFCLSKWYCDCVDSEGKTFIGYWARLRWGLFTLPYSATIYKPAAGSPHARYLVRRCDEPVVESGELRWNDRRLGIRGSWTASCPSIHRVLLEREDGAITWSCHCPSAQAFVDLAGAGRISGLGYAEHLGLTIRPWRLPFDELVWGRFISADDALTWIDWRGGEERRWTFQDGSEVNCASMSETAVELQEDGARLELREESVLRAGPLASTALRSIPAVWFLLPRGLRSAHETKWLSRGAFKTATRSSMGWAIHEVVRLR